MQNKIKLNVSERQIPCITCCVSLAMSVAVKVQGRQFGGRVYEGCV